MNIPSSARVVVIGGGIAGCSAAWHLASLGVRDVVLLERAALSSGTTWHSTGNMETYRPDPVIFEMVRYALETYPRIAAEAGQDIGWRSVGRVMYTDRESRWESMRTLPELGQARGIELELLTPAQVQQRLPIIATAELLGGVWVPSDSRVNPTDAVMAFAAAAKARGVGIYQDVPVTGIELRDGRVQGVVTAHGTIGCDTVVVAAGLWSGDLLESCGIQLPLHALEHQYLITQPLGIDRNLPLFLSLDDQLYGREEVGGIMVGSLDDGAIPLSTRQLPQNFSFSLLSERWPQFEPYMATAMRRFPLLQNAGIKMLLNGPESFTPDGQMLLGPVPGATGLFSACGFNSNGMALAPAAGRFVAEWIVEGAPSVEVAQLDVRRFGAAQASEPYMRDRVTEIPGYHCRIHAPDADYATSRDVLRSPLHNELAMAGARFTAVNAWERPLWIATSSDWTTAVAAEVAAAEESVLLIDRSADAKHLLTGSQVDEWLPLNVTTLLPSSKTAAVLTPLLGRRGQIEALVRTLRWTDDATMLIAGPEQSTRLQEWLRLADLPAGSRREDVTTGYAMLELHGMRRAALLNALGVRPKTVDPCWIGAVSVTVRDDPANDSTLLITASKGAAVLWQNLLTVGKAFGLRVGGHWAQEAARIQRGVPGFGREATPNRLAAELGGQMLAASAAGRAKADPVGNHRKRVLRAFSSPIPLLGFGAQEVVLQKGRTVGELTSRVRLPGWSSALLLALLDPDSWNGNAIETVAAGRRWPLVPRPTPWSARLS
ncbi:MAG: GcvT family protein [Proteobacteria bacterium]|nr:GcvT family protein [Pseudomonadota bacterium]